MTNEQIYEQFQHYTMTNAGTFATNLELARWVANYRGDIVECGSWRGGMMAGIATVLGNDRRYVLLDSFQGLPAALEIDGEAAWQWQADQDGPTYFDNCKASSEEAEKAMQLSGVTNFQIVKGWFKDTVPTITGPIAMLRLDADWHAATLLCLEHLFDRVVTGGLIIIDDYFVWEGCTRAVHEFLADSKASEHIRNIDDVCYLVKR